MLSENLIIILIALHNAKDERTISFLVSHFIIPTTDFFPIKYQIPPVITLIPSLSLSATYALAHFSTNSSSNLSH